MRLGYFEKRQDACAVFRATMPGQYLSIMGHEVKEIVVEHAVYCRYCGNKNLQEIQITCPGDVYNCITCNSPLYTNLNSWKASVFSQLDWCDVAIFQRNTDVSHIELMKEAKKRGKFVVCENDDNYFDIPRKNPGKKYYDLRRGTLEQMFKIADALTVTTSALREAYLPFNKNIQVIPNALDVELFDACPPLQTVFIRDGKNQPLTMEHFNSQREGRKFVCWAGSPTHEEDLEMILKPLEKLLKEENVIVGMCAYVHRYMMERYPQDRLFLFGLVPVINWNYMLQYLKPDVWLGPVIHHPFNKCKSNLKKMEAAAMGSVFVGTDYDTYNTDDFEAFLCDQEDVDVKAVNNKEVRKFPTNNDWYSNLRRAVNIDPEEKMAMADHNKKILLRDFDIKVTSLQWESFFKTGVAK